MTTLPNCCPYCGSRDIAYGGYEDGDGDYGDEVGLMCHCAICDVDFSSLDMRAYCDDPDLEVCPDCGSDYLSEGVESCIQMHDGRYEHSSPLVCKDCGCEWRVVWIEGEGNNPQ